MVESTQVKYFSLKKKSLPRGRAVDPTDCGSEAVNGALPSADFETKADYENRWIGDHQVAPK